MNSEQRQELDEELINLQWQIVQLLMEVVIVMEKKTSKEKEK